MSLGLPFCKISLVTVDEIAGCIILLCSCFLLLYFHSVLASGCFTLIVFLLLAALL